MNELKVERSQEIIALEINSIKDQTRKMALYNSIEIGKRLVEAKEVVPHGEWGIWLEQSVNYSQSTANNLMKIYEEYGNEQDSLFGSASNSDEIANLPYTKALALLGLPNYEREEFIEKNDVEDMSTRELQKAIKEKKELEEKLAHFEKEAEQHKDLKLELSMKESEVSTLQQELEDATKNNNDEAIEKLNKDIQKAKEETQENKDRVKQLEKELRDKPIDTPEIIERVPESVEIELEQLRKQVNNKSSDEAEVQFKYIFDDLTNNFKALLETLGTIKDEEKKASYKKAVEGLINQMISHI